MDKINSLTDILEKSYIVLIPADLQTATQFVNRSEIGKDKFRFMTYPDGSSALVILVNDRDIKVNRND